EPPGYKRRRLPHPRHQRAPHLRGRARLRKRDAALLRTAGDRDARPPSARVRRDRALVATLQGPTPLAPRLRAHYILPLRRGLLDNDLLVRAVHALPLRLRRARHGLDIRLRR